jgi:hypothetical protein
MAKNLIQVTIVTHRPVSEAEKLITEIKTNTLEPHFVLVTSRIRESASINRNYALKVAEKNNAPAIVMLDDDITGFYQGWLTDLVQPMIDDNKIIIASARLLNKDRTQGPMMHCGSIPNTIGVFEVPGCHYKGFSITPTSCIAIRKNDVRFDEGFKGSGYEDTHYMFCINEAYPDYKIVLNNNCKLVHLNEMKNQGGKYWEHNKKHYLSLRPDDKAVLNQTDWTRFGE